VGRRGTQIATLVERHSRFVLLQRLPAADSATVVPALAPAIHEVLRSAPDIRKITWFDEQALRRGNSAGAPTPDAPVADDHRMA